MTPFRSTLHYRSWGRVVRTEQHVASPRFRDELPALLQQARSEGATCLAAGMGRSYGTTGLNSAGRLIDMRGLNRLISFDAATGLLRAEAGVLLSEILDFAVPKGFFLPVTPGTRLITLGGAIANDVHGKNHHSAGTIGRWITRLGLVRSDAATAELTADAPGGRFAATVGGLGLTGIIAWAELRLKPIKATEIEAEEIPFADVDEFFDIAEASSGSWEYTVAWVDVTGGPGRLGRGIFSRGRHLAEGPLVVEPTRIRFTLPLDLPSSLLNGISLRAFNALYFRRGAAKRGVRRVPYLPFFYPLDAIGDWNRMYGKRGFFQYQCVLPPSTARSATLDILRQTKQSGDGSFLAVLKTFGELPSPGLLSFPMEGTTLALDFPNRGPSTIALLQRFDAVVKDAGGRLYPAKDGRMPAEMFCIGYPALDEFKRHVDPACGSDFWRAIAT